MHTPGENILAAGSASGSGAVPEQFGMGTPGSQLNENEKKFRDMEKKIKELAAIIKEYMTEMGPRKDT